MKQTHWFHHLQMGRDLKFKKYQTSRRLEIKEPIFGKHVYTVKERRHKGRSRRGWKQPDRVSDPIWGNEGQSTHKGGKTEGCVLIMFNLLRWGEEFVGTTSDSFCFPCETGGHLMSERGEEDRGLTESLEMGKKGE